MNLKDNEELVCGLNAVSQIIQTRPQSVQCLFVGQKPNGRIQSVMQKAEKSNITIDKETTSFFEDKFREQNHQNIAIKCNKRSEESENYLESILDKPRLKLLLLDGLSDPHNVGACLRSAAAADVDAVIVPKNRSCHLTPTVRKISCGASELIPFVVVTNMVRTINFLKDKGVMIYGSDLQATKTYDEVEYAQKNALIIGSEDKGIRRLTRENCDELIKIGMPKSMDSLNASVSAGILLFEISRQNKINLNK